jgi:hypothetical protein
LIQFHGGKEHSNKKYKIACPLYNTTMVDEVSSEEVSLIIDTKQIIVKRKIATKRPDDQFISKARYSTGLPVVKAVAADPNGVTFPTTIIRENYLTYIDIDFTSNPHQPIVLKYILQMVIHPSIIEKFGSLNILNWPVENLTHIYILPGTGNLFFTTAYSVVEKDRNGIIALRPPGFIRNLVSHTRKASAIRLEWGFPSTVRLIFRYRIKNIGKSMVSNINFKTYLPPRTIFQAVKYQFDAPISTDEDFNAVANLQIKPILPGGIESFNLVCDITPNGNMNAVIPNLGSYQAYREILLKNRETARFITDTKIWDFGDMNVQSLIKLMLNKAENPTEYMKMAFEFVNQKVQYKINNKREKASIALKTLVGDCSEYSDLFVALLRGGGIPAKIVHGLIVDNSKKTLEPHAWCEYFSPELGWIQCDPTWGYLAGVCCQHVSRQREGLGTELPTYSVEYQTLDSKLVVEENIEFQIISQKN